MSTLPLIFTSGWASGINPYAVVVLLGLLGRFGGVDSVPPGLERQDVLIAAALLYLVDFFCDKIPYVDNVWDAVHTIIRPTAGAVIAALIAGDTRDLDQLAAAATGGLTALASHTVKAGTRLAANTSPEPFSNIVLSLLEDFTVAGLIVLAVFHPWVAAAIAAVLLVAGLALVAFLAKHARRLIRNRRERRARRHAEKFRPV